MNAERIGIEKDHPNYKCREYQNIDATEDSKYAEPFSLFEIFPAHWFYDNFSFTILRTISTATVL
ncbi:MAG: hypothetical protein AB8B59_17095, partial [Maribacter sp.]